MVLRAGQRIDDAPEQHRLGEQRDRQRHIGDGEHPAKTDLRAEQTENARIEAKHFHRNDFMPFRFTGKSERPTVNLAPEPTP
jgi:hypothetical protein